MKHTPTPWFLSENHIKEENNYNYRIVSALMSKSICDVWRQNWRLVGNKKFKDKKTLYECEAAKANAERIIQCVNAMEGIEKVEDMVTLFNEFSDQLKNGVPVSITPNSIYGRLIISLKK